MTHIRFVSVFAALVLALVPALMINAVRAQESPGAAWPDEHVLPGDSVFPEGVAIDKRTGYFYVSSTEDGTIFRGTMDEETTEVFLPGNEDGRTAAVGLDVDDDGHLFIAGGGTGMMFVYDTETGEQVASFDGGSDPTFVNDVVATRSGAYFTDSMSPVIYRVTEDDEGEFQMEHWLDLDGTAIEYQEGFNLNGIVASYNGKYLITIQSNTGKLFRIDVEDQSVTEIDTGDETFTAGDGLVLHGHTLYIVRNQFEIISRVWLWNHYTSGSFMGEYTNPSFGFPTTADIARGRMLVVNAQFDQRGGSPELPFTVSNIPLSAVH